MSLVVDRQRFRPDPLLFASGRRLTLEGGSDVPDDWTRPAGGTEAG